MKTIIDYSILPLFVACEILFIQFLLDAKVTYLLIPTVTLIPVVLAAAILERLRPERIEHGQLDQPFIVDACHFLFNYQFGVLLGFIAASALGEWFNSTLSLSIWPLSKPIFLQILLVMFFTEFLSYWQHRLYHTIPYLWKFHRLHHLGSRLNLMRAGRFHFADIGMAVFMTTLPIIILGASLSMQAWLASLIALMGVIQHSNIRMRTPRWSHWFICTPSIHRHHHSDDLQQSQQNFCTFLMFFDVLFGTFKQPDPVGPDSIGVKGETLVNGFWYQVFLPFRKVQK